MDAEGFVVESMRYKVIEEASHEGFDGLVSRSLFQRSRSNPSIFVMHDLMHDLAQSVSKEFWFRLEGDDSNKPNKLTRHLVIDRSKSNTYQKFDDIYEAKLQPTFLLEKCAWWREMRKHDNKEALDHLWSLKHLRLLSLPCCFNVVELPNSISNLKHLRYFDLSNAPITTTPEAVYVFHNLQTLILEDCRAFTALSDSVANLKHLRHLDLSRTLIEWLPDSLCSISNLTNFKLA